MINNLNILGNLWEKENSKCGDFISPNANMIKHPRTVSELFLEHPRSCVLHNFVALVCNEYISQKLDQFLF